jgi:aromatic-amino-acid transaminase
MSLFAAVEMAPRDPILGLNEQFNADPNPAKVNLGVGVYFDDNGKLPLLKCVAEAEKQLLEAPKARGYLPIDGIAAYDKAVQGLVFGADSAALAAGRVATVQALGGTGGLKVGADFLKRLNPGAKVLISDPSWENHRALFTNAGFEVGTYPYYDAATAASNFDAHAGRLKAPRRHHRRAARLLPQPDRLRPHPAQWDAGGRRVKARGLVPSWTWPTRASATASPKTARCASSCAAGLTSSCPPRSPRASRCTASAWARSASCASKDEAAACCRS